MPGPIRIAILSNGRQARAEAALTARAYGLMGRQVSSVGKLIAGAFAVREIARAGAAVVQVGGQYVGSLNKIQALTDSSNRVMDLAAGRLEKNAGLYAKMGQTTGDAASGVVELTKAGLSLNKSLTAVRATMVLAKAGELSVADASTLVANTLNTFSLKAKDAGKIANGLANAANISSADVSDLAESFKYVSPIAAKAGVSLDQTNAILAELSNSGVKASQAGTGLRKFLLSLQAPGDSAETALASLNTTIYDAQGNMKPLTAVIGQLRKGLSKLSAERQNSALKSIFGLTGITSAQIILKNGTKGLAKYTKGVQRAGAAQKLANAASKGLKGTLDSLKASVTSTAQELYRKFSPKLNGPLKDLSKWLSKNKDDMIAAGEAAGRKLVPVLEDLATAASDVFKALKDTVVPLAQDLLPAFKKVAELGVGVVRFFNSLPGPVKEVGVQAAIAALILPRLTAGVASVTGSITLNIAKLQQWRAEMTYTETRAQSLAAMTARLMSAAKAAAGIGGMVLLMQAAKTSNKALSTLETTAGGAALGFSVGGPLGAAIGGLGGLFYSLTTKFNRTGGAAQDAYRKIHASSPIEAAKKDLEDLKATLDQVTGAYTENTRAAVYAKLQQSGAIETAAKYGIGAREVVNAALGQASAFGKIGPILSDYRQKVKDADQAQRDLVSALDSQGRPANLDADGFLTAAAQEQYNALESQKKAAQTAMVELRKMPGVLRKDAREVRATAVATSDYTGKLKAIPKNIRPKIEAVGITPTIRGVAKVARQYGLIDKKKIRALIQASGADATVKQVRRVLASLGKVKTTRGDLGRFTGDVNKGAAAAARAAKRGGDATRKGLEKGPHDAKADLSGLRGSISVGIGGVKKVASSGGHAVGANLKAGIIAGFAGTADELASQAASAVHRAVAAAKAAGDIHSPSRVMRDEVGAMLGKGLVDGVLAWKGKAGKAGETLVDKLTKGAKHGLDGIRASLQRITDLVNNKLDGKKQAAHRKALLKSLQDERRELIANGKAQDRNSEKLDKARQKLQRLTQAARDYAKGIKDGFVSYGSVVGLGTTGDSSTVSLPAMLSQLGARAQAAEKFAALIKRLRNRHLNKTSLQQLLAQAASGDIDGALASAGAIAGGGSAAIAQINQLTAQIAKAGADLGQKMKNEFFGAGIQAAQGLVDGLRKKQKELDRIAERLATALVNKVKKALGIHSPSRVFRDIGLQTVKGLSIGVDDTYAKRAGARLAGSLQQGFGQPALAAYSKQAGGVAGGGNTYQITVNVPVGASAVQAGREIVKLIDAYEAAGGRRKR